MTVSRVNVAVRPARHTTLAQTVAAAIEQGDARAGRELIRAALAIYAVALDDTRPSDEEAALTRNPPGEPRPARRRRSL